MASTSLHILMNQALTASLDGDSKSLSNGDTDFLAVLDVSSINPATTVDCIIQSSPDKLNWFDVATFTSVVGSSSIEEQQINRSLYVNVRAKVTLSGATQSATVKVTFWYDIGRK